MNDGRDSAIDKDRNRQTLRLQKRVAEKSKDDEEEALKADQVDVDRTVDDDYELSSAYHLHRLRIREPLP
jgi:hypothetical protein